MVLQWDLHRSNTPLSQTQTLLLLLDQEARPYYLNPRHFLRKPALILLSSAGGANTLNQVPVLDRTALAVQSITPIYLTLTSFALPLRLLPPRSSGSIHIHSHFPQAHSRSPPNRLQ